jgi:sensor c-di-GMP phosphodiesterase-like protein
VLGSLVLAYRVEQRRLESELDAMVSYASSHAADVLLEVEAAIADVAFDARAGCSLALVDELERRISASRVLTNMGLVSAAGSVGCTARGLLRPPVPLEPLELLGSSDALVRLTMPVEGMLVPGAAIVAMHVLRGGDRLGATFAPRDLVDLSLPEIAEQLARVRVSVEGTELARRNPPIPQGGPLIARSAPGGVLGVEAEVALPRALVTARWRNTAWLHGGLGGLAGLVLVLGALHVAGRRASLTDELVEALENQEFEVHYQPVMDLQAGRCIGAEALIRWRHPERGMVSPDLFIALAEETGYIVPITRWLMGRIGDEMGQRLRADPEFHIAINLAPAHFETMEVVEDVRAIAAQHDLAPGQLLFEATERGLMDDETCQKVIDALGELGSAVAIDDFGTGYSSLAYLDRFRLDYLKVDKAFVANIGTDAPTADLAGVIIAMAGSIGLKVIAEGVETEAQAAYLRERGVHYAQGWLYSKPLPAPSFLAFVGADAG